MITINLPGRQLTKNNKLRRGYGGRIYLDPKYKAWVNDMLRWLWQWGNITFDKPVIIKAVYTPPDKRGLPDHDNLYKTFGDLLQASGIVKNDRLISWEPLEIKNPDKANAGVVMEIREIKNLT